MQSKDFLEVMQAKAVAAKAEMANISMSYNSNDDYVVLVFFYQALYFLFL